jgi:hypothetical protein
MEHQPEKTPSPNQAFNPSPWRFLLADHSKYLFIEPEVDTRPSDELVKRVATLGRVLDEKAVILIDDAQRIDAWFRAEAFPAQPQHLHLGVEIHALALTPRLLDELPEWRRTPSPYHGFSNVEFNKPLTADPSTTMGRIWELLSRMRSLLTLRATQQIAAHRSGVSAAAPVSGHGLPTADRRDSNSRDPHPAIEALLGIRKQLRESIPMLDASTWATLRGTIGSNPTAALTKYKTQGRLFSVTEGRRDLYPKLEFDDNAAPLPVIAEILKLVPTDARGWPLLSWFNAGNVLLDGRKPLELLRDKPEAVKRAATDYYTQDAD